MKRVYLPFDTPAFKPLNSNHPLVACLVERSYDDIEFVRSPAEQSTAAPPARVLERAILFGNALDRARIDLPPRADMQMKFITSRDLVSQQYFDTSADLAFMHTAPMLLNQMPYILHLEAVTPLFIPFLYHGETGNTRLRHEYAFWYVRAMLEADCCRGIFSNLALTVAQLGRVFDSEVIARKSRHVPPGPYFTAEQAEKAEARAAQKQPGQRVEILFTNSWHQDAFSFFLRGGLDLVFAFLEVEKQFPNIHLTLRTVLPDTLNNIRPDYISFIRSHPKITVLPDMVSEEEVFELFLRADIFCLHAYGLHTVSVLRAMYCGNACIVSDAPGYDEYLTDGETGIVLPGLRAEIYSEDAESGFLRDNYRAPRPYDPQRVARLASALKFLCENPEARLAMGRNARRRVMQRNSFAGWQSGFETVLREALAA